MNLYFTIDVVPKINTHEALSVVILKDRIANTLIFSKSFNEPINSQKELEPPFQTVDSSPTPPVQHAALNDTQNKDIETNLTNYYSTSEVDRKALPQMNIDQSMLLNEESSGFPIKLRLYIDAFGRVVNVESIAVLDQDTPFAEKLTSLLYEIRFLPAKRDGLDVNSYQDLQLSFNPIPMSNVN